MSDTGRRCRSCDCPEGHTQCDHCKVCPHATTTRLCPQVHRIPHDAHDACPGWAPDDGTSPEAPPAATPLEEAQATVESLRYQIRRAREALGTDEAPRPLPGGDHPRPAIHKRTAAAPNAPASTPCRTRVTIRAIDGQEAP
jgi:hypothetical protein